MEKVSPMQIRVLMLLLFVDVLHHTEDPLSLLHEAVRVTRQSIIIKDHAISRMFAAQILRFMDWVGNARYSVSLPYNYWPREKWLDTFNSLHLSISVWNSDLGLYPLPADLVFGRSLQFITRLECGS